MSGGSPQVRLFNRQRTVALDLPRLRTLGTQAAAQCRQYQGPGEAVFNQLDVVEVAIVSDRVIARVHRQFLNTPGVTDVITFNHGEIVISATTAVRQARENGEDCNREIARYVVHGLLHLNGHEDANCDEAAAMWRAQESVLEALWPPELSQRPGIASNK